MSSGNARETALFLARIAEQAERYPDMVQEMKKIAQMATDHELSVEERNLLSVAYKNLVGSRRASWRILSSVEQSEVSKGNERRVEMIQQFRGIVEQELETTCGEILDLLEQYLIPSASSCEASVFFLKMKADYQRYLSEFKVDGARKSAAEKTLLAYTAAQDKALEQLPSTNPIRLGLALNFSVFHYEVMNTPDKACALAKQAFDEAISELDTLGEDSYKDSALIMQLLRDNLTLWTSEMSDKEPEHPAA